MKLRLNLYFIHSCISQLCLSMFSCRQYGYVVTIRLTKRRMQEVVHTDHLFSKQSNDRSGTTCLEKSFLFLHLMVSHLPNSLQGFFCLNKVTHWNVVSRISSYVQLTFTVTDISITNFFIFSKSYYFLNV